VIDVFSKYLWLRKLKDKKGESVAKAFETIFKEGRLQPPYLFYFEAVCKGVIGCMVLDWKVIFVIYIY
jgi:hypothetical protein